MAVDSLRSVAGLLTEAYAPLHAIMARRSDVPEAAAPDTVFTTVKATSDVRARARTPTMLLCAKRSAGLFPPRAALGRVTHTPDMASCSGCGTGVSHLCSCC